MQKCLLSTSSVYNRLIFERTSIHIFILHFSECFMEVWLFLWGLQSEIIPLALSTDTRICIQNQFTSMLLKF